MSSHRTLKASPNATSSLALEFGPSLFAAQDGRIIDQSGQAVAHASLSARQALELGLRTQDTFGQLWPGSSSSAALQSSLESRLRARLSSLGSTLYTLTWKPWNTPSGPSRFRLRASVRRTSETDCSGWPTPKVTDTNGPGNSANRQGGMALHTCAQLAGWPTPMAGTPAQNGNNAAGNNDSSRKTVAVCSGWPSPIANDSTGSTHCYSGKNPDGSKRLAWKLPGAVRLIGFWGGADWISCRDDRFRPVEPGTFPLANGASGRVGRLRAYGNAINAEAAKEFIAAYLETKPE